MSVKRYHYPPTSQGLRIGLFGGSFNPPHAGHIFVAEEALQTLGFDRVWMLVTPGNPLKEVSNLMSFEQRSDALETMIDDHRVIISDIEYHLQNNYSAETISHLVKRFPQVQFFWIMGADNLIEFHKWYDWEHICQLVPLIILDRPGYTHKALRSFVATKLGKRRREMSALKAKHSKPLPVWTFLFSRRLKISSSAIRRKQARLNRSVR